MTRINILTIFIVLLFKANAQRLVVSPELIKQQEQSNLYDTVKGIHQYDKLLGCIGGDSVKFGKDGYNIQGWNEDYYNNGKLLHRGYYVDGKLITFKNYYENGQCERSVTSQDPQRCLIEQFYENGHEKRKISYYNGLPQKLYEFYQNGNPKYSEENNKDLSVLTLKKSWFSDGQVESQLELTDQKNKRYKQRSYYPSGEIREEGSLIATTDNSKGLVKDGTWIYYDKTGKKKLTEQFERGKVKQK